MTKENSGLQDRPHKEIITWWKIRLFQELSDCVATAVVVSKSSSISDTKNDSEISQGEFGEGASCS